MFFLTSCLFLSALLSLTVMLELTQQHLRREMSPQSRRTFDLLLQLLPFDFIGYYLCFGINISIFLSRL